MTSLLKSNVFFIGLAFSLCGCSTISPFSPNAYEQATSLKVEALTLMEKANQPYPDQKVSVEAVQMSVEKAYEYAKWRPKNQDSISQWEVIRDPSKNSLGGFLNRWKQKTTLDSEFIQEAKSLVSDGFDTVIHLESGKLVPSNGQKQ